MPDNASRGQSSKIVLVKTGRRELARLVYKEETYLAIGGLSITPPWTDNDEPPVPSDTMTGLEREFGRAREVEKSFVVADPNGAVNTVSGDKFTKVNYPTDLLYLRYAFPHTAVPTGTLYQTGIFMRTFPNPTLPAFSGKIAGMGTYNPGATSIQIAGIDTGDISQLAVVQNPNKGSGRTIKLRGNTYKVATVDALSSIVTLQTPLLTIAAFGDAVTADAMVGVAPGQDYVVHS